MESTTITIEMINKQFGLFTSQILSYAILLAASGTLAMALLDAIKGLISAKSRFHKRCLMKWLNARYAEIIKADLESVLVLLGCKKPKPSHFIEEEVPGEPTITEACHQERRSKAFCELESLCSGIDLKATARPGNLFEIKEEQAFYSMETRQFAARVERSLEAVLRQPERSKLLFVILAAQHPGAAESWLKFLNECRDSSTEISPGADQKASRHLDQLVELLNDKLDSFQVNVEYTWGRMNRFAAMALGAALLLIFLLNFYPILPVIDMVLYSLLGGMVSPVAKNLVTTIKSIALK